MARDRRQGKTRRRLAVLLVVLATLPVLGIALAVRKVVGDSLEDGVYAYHTSVIGEVGALVEAAAEGVTDELLRVSQALLGSADPREGEAAAIATLERLPHIEVVAIYTADGKSRIAVLAKEKVAAPSAPDSIQNLVGNEGRQEVRTGAIAGGIWPVAVPLSQGTELVGWVYASVPATFVLEPITTLGEARYLGVKGAIVLVDQDGKVLGDPAAPPVDPTLGAQLPRNETTGQLQLTNRVQGALAYVDPQLGPSFARIDVLPRLRVAVIARQTEAETFAAVDRVTRYALMAVGGLAVLAVLVAAWVARRATRPLESLVEGAKEIGRARFDVRVDVGADDEIGILADSINTMAADLGDFERRLVAETQLRSSVSRYVSKDVVDLIASGKARLELGGQRQRVTIVFIDIVSFTPLSEQFPPEKIITVVNVMFTMMTSIVWKYGGTVDKFIGDCMMAIWGSPYVRPGDETRAAMAMREIMQSMGPVNDLANEVFGRSLQLTCGMNTGDAVVGNVGSDQRMEFTVIGDAVNVAARVQAQAAHDQILVTLSTATAIGDDLVLIDQGERRVKGKSEPIRIFEVPVWPDAAPAPLEVDPSKALLSSGDPGAGEPV